MAGFLRALHAHQPMTAPINPHRGVPLESKAPDIQKRIERLRLVSDLVNPKIEHLWEVALGEAHSSQRCLLHGDLHPKNVIVRQQKLTAVIDWGDLTSGDPATDVACLWMLFGDKNARNAALDRYGADQPLINRSIGWAIYFGTILLDTGLPSNPVHADMGRQILRHVYTA